MGILTAKGSSTINDTTQKQSNHSGDSFGGAREVASPSLLKSLITVYATFNRCQPQTR